MKRATGTIRPTAARRIAAIACVGIFAVATAACGSSNKSGNNDAPGGPTGTTTPATTTPATTAPQSGGAGF